MLSLRILFSICSFTWMATVSLFDICLGEKLYFLPKLMFKQSLKTALIMNKNWSTVYRGIFNHTLCEEENSTAQKIKFSIKDFFSKCDQIRWKLWIWLHLLNKSSMENFSFCAVWEGRTVIPSWFFLSNSFSIINELAILSDLENILI